MGLLARRPDNYQAQELGLPSLAVPVMSADMKRLAQKEAFELYRQQVRRNIQIARLVHLGETADVAGRVVERITDGAERRSMRCPEERARQDGIADVVASCAYNIVAELGQR